VLAGSSELARVADVIVESVGGGKSERRETTRIGPTLPPFKSLSNGKSERRETSRIGRPGRRQIGET